jgi:hypothetical protein
MVGKYSWVLFSTIDIQTLFAGKPLNETPEVRISVSQLSVTGVKGGHLKQKPPLLMSVT